MPTIEFSRWNRFFALAAVQDREQALGAGFRAHVAKPVDVAELLAVMAALAPRRPIGEAP